MIIKVRYHRPFMGDTGHVDLVACSEVSDDFYIQHNKKIFSIFFDFYPENPNPLLPCDIETSHDTYINNFSGEVVTLYSSVPFKDFCETMHNSPFTSTVRYDCLDENCVHAVYFALREAADLKVEMDNEIQCKNLIFCFWCPTNTPMPIELFDAVKKYKVALEHSTPLSGALYK